MSYTNPYFPEATLTPDIFWAHQPPAVRALRGMTSDKVALAAKQLADQGYAIDVAIMVYQWDPVTVNGIRLEEGFTWVPSGNQPNIPVMPGLVFPGLPSYDPNNPPAGSIKVSINAADYPAFDPPPPPPPPMPTNLVGARAYGNVFYSGPGAIANGAFTVTDAQQVEQNGVKFTAHLTQGLVGETLVFTMNSPQ